jgi:endonuclease III
MNKNLPIIFTYLKELFPNPETELHYSTPFQLVVAVMLSAQATDLQVNKVTEKLFKKIQKPEDLLALGFPSFKTAIRSINYYNTKAKHIYETASLLMKNEKLRIKNYKHWIPNTLEELMKLPWVGVKTGKLIAHVLYDKPFIAVDTHIHRVSNRLWLVKSPILKDTSPLHTISPEKTSELLEKIIPDSYKDHAHHSLVLFGRYYC